MKNIAESRVAIVLSEMELAALQGFHNARDGSIINFF